MYRRYYQRYNEPQDYPQRPMGEEISHLNDEEEIDHSPEQEQEIEENIAKPEIVVPEKPNPEFEATIVNRKPEKHIAPSKRNGLSSFFTRLKIEDLLIIALILILLANQCDDELLIMILIFLFFIGF
ncbi:MAG: hypothetical protein PHH48_07885 [Eubacteriales bacterium]|nr:hypothetical protein [Eubacteriales bacterium]